MRYANQHMLCFLRALTSSPELHDLDQEKEREIKLLELDMKALKSELELEQEKCKSYQDTNHDLAYQIEQVSM